MYNNDINEILRIAGIKLNEEILDAKSSDDDLINVILKNPTRKELKDNNMNTCRGAMGKNGNFYFIEISELAHIDLFDRLEQMGINEAPYLVFKYSNKTNTIYYYDPDEEMDYYDIKKHLESSPYFKPFAGCSYERFDDIDFDPDLYESYNPLNESYDRMDRPFIWNDPSYTQFHKILRDNTTYGKLSAIIDNGHIYCWDSALSHHDSVVKDIEESDIKLSDDYIWVRFKEPNLCWVSAAYFDDYTDEDLEDLPQQDFEKELEENPIIRKYFPQGVKVVRFDNISESVLNEELIHMEKSSYDDHLASIVKNPTKRELRENHLKRSRFICFADGTWLFFDSMQWIHEKVLNKYAPKFGRGENSGFYDYDKNQFIFIHGMNYDEGEDGYEEEFNHYVNKDRKFLLSHSYIKQTFGTDFNIMVYGDWVDSPWELEKYNESL